MPGTGPGTWATLMTQTEIPNAGVRSAQDTTLNMVVRGGPIEKVLLCDSFPSTSHGKAHEQ